MIGISIHLCRPPHVALNQHTLPISRQRHGTGKIKRLPRHHLLRRHHIRHDLLIGLLPASADSRARPRQRHRRPHQLQKIPARRPIRPLRRQRRKLAMQPIFMRSSPGEFFKRTPGLLVLPFHGTIDGKSSNSSIAPCVRGTDQPISAPQFPALSLPATSTQYQKPYPAAANSCAARDDTPDTIPSVAARSSASAASDRSAHDTTRTPRPSEYE